ncbi:RNZ1 protein, partial [Upupa epops]|nr:RNZ1 protein [Upupa epops]
AGKITKIFITHLHGDHFFGLPGLLCTISLQSSADTSPRPPVEIYGPLGLGNFIRRSLELSHSQLLFPYVVHELVPTSDQCPAEEFKDFSSLAQPEAAPPGAQGRRIHLDPEEDSYLLLEDEQLVVKGFRLFHRIPSFGFVVEEKARTGRLNVQKLQELGIPAGPLYGKLKTGSTITLENGLRVSPSDVLHHPIPGRKICILGDCSGIVGNAAVSLCFGADILIHEATLDDSQEEKAREHGHSTPKTAAGFAELCRVKRLVLNHFSQRYKPVALRASQGDATVATLLKAQAQEVFRGGDVTLAEDFLTIVIPMKK